MIFFFFNYRLTYFSKIARTNGSTQICQPAGNFAAEIIHPTSARQATDLHFKINVHS